MNPTVLLMGRRGAAFAAAAFLAGCASFSEDRGFDTVRSAVQSRIGQEPVWVRDAGQAESLAAEVNKRLAEPLGPDDAVRIALLNNRGLQATYAELGIAEADLVQAGRLINPGFSFARLLRGSELEIERSVFVNLMSLITLPLAKKVQAERFEQAKLRVAGEAVRVAADTRRAWTAAVSAREAVVYFEQVKSAAEASAELGNRMARSGNWSRLNYLREQTFYAETVAQLARMRQTTLSEREKLARLMGLPGGEDAFRLPERLPDLPSATREARDLEAEALEKRLDVQAGRREVDALAEAIGLARVTGYVNTLELKYLRKTEAPKEPQTGWEVEFRLPIFDWGDARIARAQSQYMQSFNRAAQLAVNARSEVREAYSAYRTAYDVAKHYRDEIVPLRKRISEENVLRYNGMLISVFELLADARQQVTSVSAYLAALREFWVAEANLQTVTVAGSAPLSASASINVGAAAMPAAAPH